jgi:hypothetical protein
MALGMSRLATSPFSATAAITPTSAPAAPAGGGNPYAINFNAIPFVAPSSNQFSGLGGTPQQAMAALGPAYQENFANALNFSRAQGQQINQGYNTAMEQQLAGQHGVMDTINQYGAGARQDIADTGAQQQGTWLQNLVGRGLGNFTVQDAATRAVNYDQGKLNLHLGDIIANMKAAAQQQAIQQNTNLATGQLGFLERMNANYPSADPYMRIAQMFGAAGQSAGNQGQIQGALDRMQGAANQRAPMGGIGAGGQGAPQRAYSPPVGGVAQSPGYGIIGGGAGVGAGAYYGGAGSDDFAGYGFGDLGVGGNDFASYDPSLDYFYNDVGFNWGDAAGDTTATYDPSLDYFYNDVGFNWGDAGTANMSGYDPSLDFFYSDMGGW